MEGYGKLCSEFYDLTKPVGGDYQDVDYYIRRLSNIGGRALEVAVGTGRLLVPLLEAGLLVDGMDSSEEMLDYCRRNCEVRGLHPQLYTADLRSMSLPERYSAVVLSFGSFMLIDPADAEAALRNLARHLTPGGKVFIDLEPPPENATQSQRTLAGRDGAEISLEESTTVDSGKRSSTTLLRYKRLQNGHTVETEQQLLHLRHYGESEFADLLRESGFGGVTLCADYLDRSTPNWTTEHLCFTAERTG